MSTFTNSHHLDSYSTPREKSVKLTKHRQNFLKTTKPFPIDIYHETRVNSSIVPLSSLFLRLLNKR